MAAKKQMGPIKSVKTVMAKQTSKKQDKAAFNRAAGAGKATTAASKSRTAKYVQKGAANANKGTRYDIVKSGVEPFGPDRKAYNMGKTTAKKDTTASKRGTSTAKKKKYDVGSSFPGLDREWEPRKTPRQDVAASKRAKKK